MFNDKKPDEIINGIKVYGSGIELCSYLGRLLKSPKYLYQKAIEINADFYQTFDVENIITCLLLKRKGKKIIFDLLENHPYSYFEKSNKPQVVNRLIIAPFVVLMKYGVKLNSFAIAEIIEDFPVPGGPYRSIPKWYGILCF